MSCALQVESFPGLAELDPAARKALNEKFLFTDDLSLREYMLAQGLAI